MAAEAQQLLLDRARRGATDALGELLVQFRPYVRLLVKTGRPRSTQARFDDSDLIQDTMVIVHLAFLRFRGETLAQFAGWIRAVTRRTLSHSVRDHVGTGKRDISREQMLEDLDQLPQNSESDAAARHERAAQIAAILERLPDDMRDLLMGRFLEELSYAELAKRTGRSEGALRVLYTRALRRLREEMGVERG